MVPAYHTELHTLLTGFYFFSQLITKNSPWDHRHGIVEKKIYNMIENWLFWVFPQVTKFTCAFQVYSSCTIYIPLPFNTWSFVSHKLPFFFSDLFFFSFIHFCIHCFGHFLWWIQSV
jgi:hypothetical protein